MSVLRKAAVYLGLYDDEHGDDVYEYEEPVNEAERPVARPVARQSPDSQSGVRQIRDTGHVDAPSGVRVTAGTAQLGAVRTVAPPKVHVVDPKSFNDAQEVGDRLKTGTPVILNLEGSDKELQRRLIDFSSGLCYAIGGTMSKAADHVFLLTPPNVEVTDDEKERLRDRGLYRR